VEIYKRGPLFTTQVMLSARSFGELAARYKFLHILALHDRALVTRVEELHDRVTHEQTRLAGLRSALEVNRGDKAREEAELRALEDERGATLTRTRAQRGPRPPPAHQGDRAQFANIIANLDADRRRPDDAARRAQHEHHHTSDYGRLMGGPLVYTFGRRRRRAIRPFANGVGIRAGRHERAAVAPGRVVNVGQLGTYGPTVIIDHGGGAPRSTAPSTKLTSARSDGDQGQVIASVSDPELPPALHFEIATRSGWASSSVDPRAG
jgi:septal ring factor EnvC (AmiA/AmiB activator)